MNEPKHVVSILRRMIGLKQKEFGALVGRSLATIQGIEYGEMKLSDGMADAVARQTGVSIDWLLKNDTSKAPAHWKGHPYTKADFENQQAWINRKLGEEQSDLVWTRIMVLGAVREYCCVATSALKKDRFILFNYKYRQLLRELEKEFGTDPSGSASFSEQDDLVSVSTMTMKKLDSVIDKTLTSAKSKTTPRRRTR